MNQKWMKTILLASIISTSKLLTIQKIDTGNKYHYLPSQPWGSFLNNRVL